MTSENGYIKLYRSLMNKGYYKDSEYVHLWVCLLMKASYQSREFFFNGELQQLKAGQLITGRNSLALETGINRSKIERILKCFKNEHQIEQQTNNKFRIISICNWEKYQTSEQQNEPQVSSERATSEQQVSTYNKDKKVKKDKKDKNKIYTDDFLAFYKAYPRKEGKSEAWKAWNKLNGNRPSMDEVLKAIEDQKNSKNWIKDGGQYIPQPAKWINQRRWEDQGIEKHPLSGKVSDTTLRNIETFNEWRPPQ